MGSQEKKDWFMEYRGKNSDVSLMSVTSVEEHSGLQDHKKGLSVGL